MAYLGLNGPIVATLLFAAARAGVPICLLNYRLPAEQILDLVDQLEAPYIIVGAEHLDLLPGRTVRVADEWLAEALVEPSSDGEPATDESPAVLLFTSGTTAAPKAAVLRHENLLSYVLQTVEFASAD